MSVLLSRLRLRVVFINCPGNLSRIAITKVREFVGRDGFLVTTGWALKRVIEPALPGIIGYNEKHTRDDNVSP